MLCKKAHKKGMFLRKDYKKPYIERLSRAYKKTIDLVFGKISDPTEADEFAGELLIYINDMIDIYIDIVMKSKNILSTQHIISLL